MTVLSFRSIVCSALNRMCYSCTDWDSLTISTGQINDSHITKLREHCYSTSLRGERGWILLEILDVVMVTNLEIRVLGKSFSQCTNSFRVDSILG